jgi:hypothetical protein
VDLIKENLKDRPNKNDEKITKADMTNYYSSLKNFKGDMPSTINNPIWSKKAHTE